MSKIKTLLTALLTALMTVLLLTSCASPWEDPYEKKDREGYRVSIRFDANGGVFGSIEGETYMVDVFRLADGTDTSDGKKAFSLLSPDDTRRGNNNAFTVSRANHLLAGWYTREETGVGTDGKPSYRYTKWDFASDRVILDADGSYSSGESVLTLYAMWIPEFTFEIYAKNASGVFEKISEVKKTSLSLPSWKEGKARIDMNGFPERTGYTFVAAYTDAAMQNRVTAASVTGDVDATFDGGDRTVKLYTEWYEGRYIKVYSAKDIKDNNFLNGHFYLQNDIDFEKTAWPSSFTTGEFKGKIEGNGYAIKNITASQSDAKGVAYGIFGRIADTAVMNNVRFENASYTVKQGAIKAEATFGLFAGEIAGGASFTDVSVSGTLYIASDLSLSMFRTTYLLAGDGGKHGIDASGITCRATTDTPPFLIAVHSETGHIILQSVSPAQNDE